MLAPPIEKYNYIEHFFQALNYSNMKIASIIMVVFHTVTNSHTTAFNLFIRNGQFTSVFPLKQGLLHATCGRIISPLFPFLHDDKQLESIGD